MRAGVDWADVTLPSLRGRSTPICRFALANIEVHTLQRSLPDMYILLESSRCRFGGPNDTSVAAGGTDVGTISTEPGGQAPNNGGIKEVGTRHLTFPRCVTKEWAWLKSLSRMIRVRRNVCSCTHMALLS